MLAGKIAPADTSPELAAASGLCPNNSISSAKTSRTTQVWRTGLTGLPCRRSRHNLCFHFAFGFCGTLRLAHMLYSLARVSRRDRWCRTFHHPGRHHFGGRVNWYDPPATAASGQWRGARSLLMCRGVVQSRRLVCQTPVPGNAGRCASAVRPPWVVKSPAP